MMLNRLADDPDFRKTKAFRSLQKDPLGF
ncbi:hypothetical protein, partial [Azospirillum melinis]